MNKEYLNKKESIELLRQELQKGFLKTKEFERLMDRVKKGKPIALKKIKKDLKGGMK